MARGRSGQRATIDSPSLDELLSEPVRPLPVVTLPTPLQQVWHEIQDNRQFHPEGIFRAPAVFPSASRSVIGERRVVGRATPVFTTAAYPAFERPKDALVCARRKSRREVMFAKRLRGRGGSSRRRRNWMTEVKC